MTAEGGPKVSDDLERWFNSDEDKTIGRFSECFGEKTFALLCDVCRASRAEVHWTALRRNRDDRR